jgi:undecaprenyl-diphosphatase
METLESVDRAIVLFVNSFHSPFWDEFMWIVSAKLTWMPLYALLIFLFIRQSGIKKGIAFTLCAVAAVGLADLVSVHLFKEMFMRYRPSHHALLTDQLHYYTMSNGEIYKGGEFGFVSSHAVNFFAIGMFSYLGLHKTYPKILYLLLGVATLVAYSRLYLGVHYLSDVLAGGLLGILIAYLVFRYVFMTIIGKEFYKK